MPCLNKINGHKRKLWLREGGFCVSAFDMSISPQLSVDSLFRRSLLRKRLSYMQTFSLCMIFLVKAI